MRTVTPDQAVAVVRGYEGNRYTMVDYLGTFADTLPGEQAYLVRQQAPELRPHFHEVDQFQVITAGEGTLGRDRAVAGVLHYTDAYTSYGPICTDPEIGLSYFTLRRQPTTGVNYMPEEREKRAREAGASQHFTVLLDDRCTVGAGLHELARTDRGAAAYGVRLGGGEELRAQTLPTGQAGYVVVLGGVVTGPHGRMPAESLVSFDDTSELQDLRAERGATLAVLLFPHAAVAGAA